MHLVLSVCMWILLLYGYLTIMYNRTLDLFVKKNIIWTAIFVLKELHLTKRLTHCLQSDIVTPCKCSISTNANNGVDLWMLSTGFLLCHIILSGGAISEIAFWYIQNMFFHVKRSVTLQTISEVIIKDNNLPLNQKGEAFAKWKTGIQRRLT